LPVTARLSRRFYDTFGDEITNELVDWFNQVDTAYRFELRELNEVNFARFDGKLEQRIAEVKADVRQEIGGLHARLDSLRADLIKWMFIFWAGTTLTVLGTTIALLKL